MASPGSDSIEMNSLEGGEGRHVQIDVDTSQEESYEMSQGEDGRSEINLAQHSEDDTMVNSEGSTASKTVTVIKAVLLFLADYILLLALAPRGSKMNFRLLVLIFLKLAFYLMFGAISTAIMSTLLANGGDGEHTVVTNSVNKLLGLSHCRMRRSASWDSFLQSLDNEEGTDQMETTVKILTSIESFNDSMEALSLDLPENKFGQNLSFVEPDAQLNFNLSEALTFDNLGSVNENKDPDISKPFPLGSLDSEADKKMKPSMISPSSEGPVMDVTTEQGELKQEEFLRTEQGQRKGSLKGKKLGKKEEKKRSQRRELYFQEADLRVLGYIFSLLLAVIGLVIVSSAWTSAKLVQLRVAMAKKELTKVTKELEEARSELALTLQEGEVEVSTTEL